MNTAAATADVIRQQITPGVMMSVGAHKLGHYTDAHDQHALVFAARVLPFNTHGERSERPRIMRVIITHTADDTYDIAVEYRRGQKTVRHFEAAGVYADQLPATLLAVDSDDDLQHASIGHRTQTQKENRGIR